MAVGKKWKQCNSTVNLYEYHNVLDVSYYSFELAIYQYYIELYWYTTEGFNKV